MFVSIFQKNAQKKKYGDRAGNKTKGDKHTQTKRREICWNLPVEIAETGCSVKERHLKDHIKKCAMSLRYVRVRKFVEFFPLLFLLPVQEKIY